MAQLTRQTSDAEAQALASDRDAEDGDAVAVFAHLCLNALAGLQAALETLADPGLAVPRSERSSLLIDLIGGIRQVEELSRSLIRGAPHGSCLTVARQPPLLGARMNGIPTEVQ